MTDSEYLKWVAEHMVHFELGFSYAKMEYVDSDGFTHKTFVNLENPTSDLDSLKQLINKANENVSESLDSVNDVTRNGSDI